MIKFNKSSFEQSNRKVFIFSILFLTQKRKKKDYFCMSMISLQGEFMSVNERLNVDYQGVVTCVDCDGKILIIGE